MNKTDLTKLNAAKIIENASLVASSAMDLAKTEAEKSKEIECERFKSNTEILKNEKLTSEEKKYYFDENNKIYLQSKMIDTSWKIGFAVVICSAFYWGGRALGLIKPID